ncbi:MAG: penicillin-binding protein 2 [Candidatus Tantalella remota]|nr:penicillin-binding protein 2 [Candidatus Tantalella remota]
MFRARQYLLFFLLIAALVSLLIRLFFLQVLQFDNFAEMAQDQHNKVLKVEARRGTIFDRRKEPLAINLDVLSVYADPRSIKQKETTAEILGGILNLDKAGLQKKLGRDKSFIWIKRKIDEDSVREIRAEKLTGVHFLTESRRSYPSDNTASHIVGFAGMDNNGLEGLEMVFDDKLKGTPGWRHLVRDAKRRTVMFNDAKSVPAENGHNLLLTIDGVIQYVAEEEIRKMAVKYNASGATAVVMDPHTGEILAMASYPDYDLNDFSNTPRDIMKNSAVSSIYEPGSVFKIVAASAALNEGTVQLEDEFDCENGEYRVGGRVLHDYHSYGNLSFIDVIAKSSNIGTVKVAQDLGEDKLYEYIEGFGFGSKTGIDLPGEVAGISRPPSRWSRSDITTIPMGQGIAVTPVQLASAISVIANGGYLMKPYVVDSVTNWEGDVIESFGPVQKRKVLDEETCDKMIKILRRVVTDGTGRRAKSRKYAVCGKTGTAQMVNPAGGYYDNKYYATFIGFAPEEDPRICVVVIARDPHPVYFGGSVAGPAFRRIAERTLQYLGVKPSPREQNDR